MLTKPDAAQWQTICSVLHNHSKGAQKGSKMRKRFGLLAGIIISISATANEIDRNEDIAFGTSDNSIKHIEECIKLSASRQSLEVQKSPISFGIKLTLISDKGELPVRYYKIENVGDFRRITQFTNNIKKVHKEVMLGKDVKECLQ